jgi:hypothetical protein
MCLGPLGLDIVNFSYFLNERLLNVPYARSHLRVLIEILVDSMIFRCGGHSGIEMPTSCSRRLENPREIIICTS